MDATTFDAILRDVHGGLSVRKAIDKSHAQSADFYLHINGDKEAESRYARAKSAQLEAIADEIVQLADESREGSKTRETKDGTFIETGDMVERTRLQIDTRKWLLSKLAPKKYGDRLELDHRGEGFAITIKPPEKTGG
jgi:hypothetical protein